MQMEEMEKIVKRLEAAQKLANSDPYHKRQVLQYKSREPRPEAVNTQKPNPKKLKRSLASSIKGM